MSSREREKERHRERQSEWENEQDRERESDLNKIQIIFRKLFGNATDVMYSLTHNIFFHVLRMKKVTQ